MKYLIILLFFVLVSPVFAVDATPSAKAQDLLDRVATKVAQLSARLQKSYTGKIKSLGSTSIIISTPDKDRSITTSDATSFFRFRANTHTEVNFAALKIGDDISAIGTVDPATSDLTARQIIAKINRTNLVGTITGIDKEIVTIDGSTKIDLTDAVALKKIASNSGTIVSAKEADFKAGAQIFAIIHSPDSKTGIFSTLKALVLIK